MSEVKEKLNEYIEKGNFLLNLPAALDIESECESWKKTVYYFLQSNFKEKMVVDFEKAKNDYSLSKKDREEKDYDIFDAYFEAEVKKKLAVLKGLKENFEYFQKDNSLEKKVAKIKSNKIFIVHGRDNEAKLSVESFLKKLDLNPIILHEQPNKGRTIIEKFEDYSEVGFAVVLLTPDDIGGLKGEDSLKDRARQNVIFELGYFIGRLGRENVCALYKGVEKPSDLDGILYVSMDKVDWKTELAIEINASGMQIDINKLLVK